MNLYSHIVLTKIVVIAEDTSCERGMKNLDKF